MLYRKLFPGSSGEHPPPPGPLLCPVLLGLEPLRSHGVSQI